MIETTIIIPVYNEIDYIKKMLDSLINNDYNKNLLEIIIYDGLSDDGTKAILDEYENKYAYIKVYTNQKKLQVYALNASLKHVSGNYIIRCDAHSIYPKEYISTLVRYLKDSDESVGNVAGQAISIPGANTSQANAVSILLKHPLGVGISHRSKNVTSKTEVDTVLFGAWKRDIFQKIGDFDENFVRGQDYEHNKRLISCNYKVILLPNLKFKYYTRTNIYKLSKMVYQYAYAKTQIIKKYKEFPSIRVIIPALFLLGLLMAPFIKEIYVVYLVYVLLIVIASVKAASNIKTFFYLMIAFPSMHVSHGFGFLRGMLEQFILNKSKINWKSTR